MLVDIIGVRPKAFFVCVWNAFILMFVCFYDLPQKSAKEGINDSFSGYALSEGHIMKKRNGGTGN